MDNVLLSVIDIAEEAGKVLLQIQGKVHRIPKDRKDFLTDADLTANNLIIPKINKLTPGIPIYSEENNEKLREAGRMWVIDPLDGTVNFFHQDLFWGVSIALVENGKTKLGVVHLPAFNQTFAAKGTIRLAMRDVPLGVRKETRLSEAQIWTDWGKNSEDVLLLLPKLKRVSLYPQIRLCATASLMKVATGGICAYIHPHPAPEDFAAGALIVEAAGGKVTDLQGRPWNIFSKSLFASNGMLHEQILNTIK